ncbi:efflux RND transporter periplasmic adaptor subunit [Haliea sp. E1-2-M8]|uniref:efflux RND transporter periplasmic adaptor subunit n=1 Tax=Haliea sp. E1-2-M8 TaxID=3064706 RepID=UPI00271CCBDA|nr:efflux RND transporter periplasmic adaptor subunit [Haliea sp. E1-2-M8]MDO8861694.1 efflux RND transporter periplasmic adaptor subunit [Haliea sp. E1-2-M8]
MKNFLLPAIAVAVIAAILVPRLLPSSDGDGQGTAARPPGGGAAPVRTQRIQPEPFESRLTFNGTLMADQSIHIRSELRGKVEQIHFTDSQDVQKGDLIVVIESGEIEAELRSLQEQLALASTQADRLQNLFKSGSVTASERDDAASRQQVLRAEVERLQVRLAKTRITAPFAGTLGLRNISTGDLIEADTLITTLQTVSKLMVDFSVPERFQRLVQPQTVLSLRVAGHEQPFTAVVRAVDPRVDVATRTLTVRADVDNPDRKLLPGNYARVELVSRNEAALVVPNVAVLQSLDQVSVFTVEDGIAVRNSVQTGHRDETRVEILQGLEPGAEIITSGIQSVRDGQRVNIQRRLDLG